MTEKSGSRSGSVVAIAAAVALVMATWLAPARAATLNPGDFVVLTPPWGLSQQLVELDGASGSTAVVASGGMLAAGTDLAVRDAGTVLVTVPGTGVVRVDISNGTQSVFAGPGVLGAGTPSGITLGPDGSIYVSMQGGNPRIVQLAPDGASARVVTSGGYLLMPAGMCFRTDGQLYACETIQYPAGGGGGLVQINPASGAQRAIASNALLVGPFHVAVAPDGTLWSVQFGGLSQRRNACVVRTRITDGYSEQMTMFECTGYGIAIRGDGTTVVGECARIQGDCMGQSDLYVAEYPSGTQSWGYSGPVAVVPEFSTPVLRRSWGGLKAVYR